MKIAVFSGACLALSAFGLVGCSDTPTAVSPGPESRVGQQKRERQRVETCAKDDAPIALGSDERLVSIVATNDIHGSIYPKRLGKEARATGGMAFFAGAMKSIRDGMASRYGKSGGVLLLDGGDQFQGTLLSNYTEGALMFSLMNDAGYDAVVPGNHDYDFGPANWLVDQVPASSTGDSKEVIKGLAAMADFPLLSANTYVKETLKTIEGKAAKVENVGCASADLIDWSAARRPTFLSPFKIKEVAGLRVAIVGLDNPETPLTTTLANVSDLCFRDPVEEYKSIRSALEGAADLFVIVIHDGDINQDKNLTKLLNSILAWRADGVDAIVGGHTHAVNKVEKDGVWAIQSAANGERFGRIDLVYSQTAHKVLREKTRVAAGAYLYQESCDPQVDAFCSPLAGQKVEMECEPVNDAPASVTRIADAEKDRDYSTMRARVLGYADEPIRRDRDNESPLVNLLTDAFRTSTGADVALINTGGVRTDLPEGNITYENLYQVSPFNNRAVMLSMSTATLVKIMLRSAQSCGRHGSVLASGIKGTYRRGKCTADDSGLDTKAALLSLSLVGKDGSETLLYDARDPAHPVMKDLTLAVATLDFLATGGSGFDAFKEATPLSGRIPETALFRELVADELGRSPTKISAKVDGRWMDLAPISGSSTMNR